MLTASQHVSVGFSFFSGFSHKGWRWIRVKFGSDFEKLFNILLGFFYLRRKRVDDEGKTHCIIN
jgi:hypothetical protein